MSIIVTQDGQPARRIEAGDVPQESYLQDFILANPESLPLTDIREGLQFAVVRGLEPAGGSCVGLRAPAERALGAPGRQDHRGARASRL